MSSGNIVTSETPEAPWLSIISTHSPDSEPATALQDSLREQTSDSWELLLTGPGATVRTTPWTSERLGSAEGERRGEDVCSDLASLFNSACEVARGQFVVFANSAAVLSPDTVRQLKDAVATAPTADIVYTDEVKQGREVRKPVFSPERLRSHAYFGNLTAYRRELVTSIGGMRDLPGAEHYDLSLRASGAARRVEHLSQLLYRSNEPSPPMDAPALASVEKALADHLSRTGGGHVDQVLPNGFHRTRRSVAGRPLVSIIIPTRGDSATVHASSRCLVVEAVRSVIERTDYDNYEIVVVIDDVAPASVAADLQSLAGDRLRLVPWSDPFSFSGKMNLGVLHSRGDFLLLLNDDVEVISSNWLSSMLALGQRPNAGLVGAMLYFEDDTIQHAGHAYYRLDVTHIGLYSHRGALGPNGAFAIEREVDGVTAACALMPRDVYFTVGGFTSLLPGNFNDVDLCMKVSACGFDIYWTPYAELYHFESKSRNPKVAPYELDKAWGRWQHHFWNSDHWPENPHQIYTR